MSSALAILAAVAVTEGPPGPIFGKQRRVVDVQAFGNVASYRGKALAKLVDETVDQRIVTHLRPHQKRPGALGRFVQLTQHGPVFVVPRPQLGDLPCSAPFEKAGAQNGRLWLIPVATVRSVDSILPPCFLRDGQYNGGDSRPNKSANARSAHRLRDA